jgi:hypothetical protein
MAVKVMVAPAIAKGELEKTDRTARRAAPAAAKPKRRRSSVYDGDGNEVFITLMCLKCHKMRPLVQFGLRKMADGAIRNQPWCRTCRSGAGAEKPHVATAQALPLAEPTDAELAGADAAALSDEQRGSRNVAAEVAAALAAGRR